MQELEYPFDVDFILSKKKRLKKDLIAQIEKIGGALKKRIAILGGSTTNDITLILELFLLNYGISPEFYESEYNQYYQDAMFPNTRLDSFKPDIIYICTSIRNITQFPKITDSSEQIDLLITGEMEKFSGMWKRLEDVYHCPIIQNNFELPFYRLLGNKDSSDIHGAVNFITRLNIEFYKWAQTHENFFICDINYISADYGIQKWSDPFYYYMYKYALAVPAIPYLSFNLANIIKSIFGKNKKGFVLDLDNTLWGGVIGEDGVENIILGPEESEGQAYTEFQRYIKAHKQLGIILTVDSKNDEVNALAGLNHPDSELHPDDFIVIKANWKPKDRNFIEIVKELNLLPESLVFIDDNPAEREIVKNHLGVSAPEIGEVENYIEIIDRSGFFEVTNISSDDLKRNKMYAENIKRAKLEASFADYNEYLLSLEMRATIKPFESLYMARISQLTNKSNQFNLTTKRCTQTEIENFAADTNYITLYGKLEDKFGDNGVVSVVFGHFNDDDSAVFHIDLWLMSCRVLKRNMEQAMMDTLVEKCLKRGAREIRGYYYPTAKNTMVKEFFAEMGYEKLNNDENGNTIWRLNIAQGYEKKNCVIKINGEKL